MSKKNQKIAKRILRPELYFILTNESKLIQRFVGLGFDINIIKDEKVYAHTLRLLSLNPYPTNLEIQLTLLIHDLPEVRSLIISKKNFDTTAVEKHNNSELDQKVEKIEEDIAKKIFIPNELKLYNEFSNASDFLKGRSQKLPTGVGLLCKIIDKIDDQYHLFASVSTNKSELKGQTLAFEQYIIFSERLSSLKDTLISPTAIKCQELLNKTMSNIIKIWKYQDETPPQILESISKFEYISW